MSESPCRPRWSASFVGTLTASLSQDGREQVTLIVKQALDNLDRKLDPETLEPFLSDLDDALGLYENALEAQQTSSLSGTRKALRDTRKAARALAYRLRALDVDARTRIRLSGGHDLFKVEAMVRDLNAGLNAAVAEVERYENTATPPDNATCHLLVLVAQAMKSHFDLNPSAVVGGTLHSIAEAMLEDFHGEETRGEGNIVGRKLLLRALKTPITLADDGVVTIGADVT